MGGESDIQLARFGVFELDVRTGDLRKSGVKVKLREQPFQILRALVEEPGELVTREQLQQQLWPADTYVDFEHGLNAAVKNLRDTLGDSARGPRYIETLPKKGYRFIAPVELVADEKPVEPSPLPPWRLAGFAVAVALAAVVAWYALRTPSELEIEWAPERKLTYSPGEERAPRISPDGSRVAYVWDDDVYVRYLDAASSEPVQITDTPEREWGPAWSPDGTKLVFARILEARRGPLGTRAELIVVSPTPGAAETKLTEVYGRFPPFDPAWSPDGEHIAYSCRAGGADDLGGPSQICIYSLETRQAHAVTSGEGIGDQSAIFAPGGGSIAYKSGLGFSVLRLSEDMQPVGEPTDIRGKLFFPNMAGWSPDGGSVIVASRLWTGEEGLWLVAPEADAEPRLLRRAAATEADVWQGSAGRMRIVYSEEIERAQIMRVDLDRQPVGDAVPLTESTGMDFSPQIALDGERIAFMSDRTGVHGVWLCTLDDCREPDPLVELPPFAGLSIPMWSPKGDRILVDSIFRVNGRQAYIVDVASRQAGPNLTDTVRTSRTPSWTRDGEAFYSTGAGPPSIWKQSLSTGQLSLFLGGYGNGPTAESPDGKLLYFIHDRDVMRVAIGARGEAQGEPEMIAEQAVGFAPASGGVYYREMAGPVWYRPVDQSAPRKVVDAPPIVGGVPGAGITVSPDERWLLYTDRKPTEVDLKLLESVE